MYRRIYIFLDFDGVTHPFFPRADQTDAGNQYFSKLPKIEAVIREFDEALIVISSTWRCSHTLEQLQAFFSEDMRHRVIGVTPEFPMSKDGTEWIGCRQREVEAYLASNGLSDAPWVALDDVIDNYLPDAPLVFCDDKFGVQEAEVLREKISSALNKISLKRFET